ncbi:MAG: hypothetical protein HC767_06505 [Akkermansiaceae bacterium]|nr:hypothetical protein [Akkermansiaceae bacterium]
MDLVLLALMDLLVGGFVVGKGMVQSLLEEPREREHTTPRFPIPRSREGFGLLRL